MTTVETAPWAVDDLPGPESELPSPEFDLSSLDDGPTMINSAAPTPAEGDRDVEDPTVSPLVAATSAVSAWVQESPRLDPTEPPPELRTVATDREQTVSAAMSHRRLVSLEIHPEIWMQDPADVTNAVIDAVNSVLTQHEADCRAELERTRSGIGEVSQAASELHDSVAEALGRELDDVIASVSRGGAGATVQPTEARS